MYLPAINKHKKSSHVHQKSKGLDDLKLINLQPAPLDMKFLDEKHSVNSAPTSPSERKRDQTMIKGGMFTYMLGK
jgi:hypothetical protein